MSENKSESEKSPMEGGRADKDHMQCGQVDSVDKVFFMWF